MRCDEARQQIERLDTDLLKGSPLADHLESCESCRRLYEAELTLRHDMNAVRASAERAEPTPLPEMQRTVEARLRASSTSNREYSLMAKLITPFRTRPRLSASIAAVAVILAIGTLVPFSVERFSGYEVAVAGVNPDLALNSERVGVLLNALEMPHAEVEVQECNPTCKVVIRNLRNQTDAQTVAAAFDEMKNCIVESVIEIHDTDKTNLFEVVNIKLNMAEFGDPETTDPVEQKEIQQKVTGVIEELSHACNSDFTIFEFRGKNIIFTPNAVASVGVDEHHKFIQQMAQENANGGFGYVRCYEDKDGAGYFEIVDSLGNHFEYDLSDPEAAAKLKEIGLNIQYCLDEAGFTEDEDEAAAKAGEGNLPEGFALSQNYPNPFNPTTTIEFTIPTSQPVTLEIINIQGQKVRTLVNSTLSAGTHAFEWDSRSDAGTEVASGVYFYRLQAGDFWETRKMSLVK